MGPISQCNALTRPCNYYIQTIISTGYTWSCIGGTYTYISNSEIVVNWDPTWTGVYSVTVHLNPDCYTTLFLQPCDCPVPAGAREIMDISERDFPTMNALANAIDPINSTVFSNRIEINNAILFIRGEFNIYLTRIHFINCILIMDQGSIIYTPGQSSLYGQKYTSTQLYGACNYMWKGIVVGPEGRLIMEARSRLQDAEYGITINYKMHLELSESNFSRNYVCIYGPPTLNVNHFLGDLSDNEFDGSIPLVAGRFIGQNYQGQVSGIGGSYPAPQNNKSFAGFELHDVDYGSNPYSLPFSLNQGSENWFHDFHVGIYGNNSQLDVFNCRFENNQYFSPYYFYGDFGGSAIYAQTSASHIPTQINIGDLNTPTETKSNYFFKNRRSVYLKNNLNSNMQYNEIEDNSFISMEVAGSLLNSHTISNNIINGTSMGIFSNLNPGSIINIENNNITSLNNQSAGKWMIFISDAGVGSTCQANVTNNTILSYSTFGIRGWNNENSTYSYNGVTMDHTGLGATGRNVFGISLLSGRRNTVECNYSGGPTYPANAFYNNYQRSFYFQMSVDNIVSCNTATKSYFGYEFHSGCDPTQFYGNKHYDLYDGLLIGDYFNQVNSGFGAQNLVPSTSNTPGNLFFGRDNFGNFAHSATMTINSSPQPNDLWVNNGLYFPLTNNTINGIPFSPIDQPSFVPYECNNCGHGGGGGAQGAAETIVMDPFIPNSIDEELMKWNREKNLFEKLLRDSALLDSSIVLQNFMDSTQFNNKGKFGDISNDLNVISDEKANGMSLSALQLLIDASEYKNNGITPVYSFEEAQKLINEILLNTIVKGIFQFTEVQTETILEIANSCPFVNGPAVHQARSLANFLDAELEFDDYDLCGNTPQLRKRNLSAIKSINASIYPNPTDNKISVIFPWVQGNSGVLKIVNSLGLCVYTKLVNSYEDLTNMDVHSVAPGIYSIILTSKENSEFLGQFSIIR